LSDQRVEKLEAIGFSWGKKKDVWNDRFKELKQFWTEVCSLKQDFQTLFVSFQVL